MSNGKGWVCSFLLYENYIIEGSTWCNRKNIFRPRSSYACYEWNPHSWESFIRGISVRDELPKFDRLRADCIQEECRLEARGNCLRNHHEDDHVLAAHTSKGREKKGNYKRFRDESFVSAPDSKKGKGDLSRIQGFRCDKYVYIARDFYARPKIQVVATNVENSSPQKESDENSEQFSFISALFSNISTNYDTWLIGSGVSCHITGYKEHLLNVKEKDSHLQVIIGDDASYSVKSVGSTSFKLDLRIPLHLSDVLFVPGIKRNLISISDLEDKGYHFALVDCKVLA